LGQDLVSDLVDDALREADRRSVSSTRGSATDQA